MAQRSNRIHKPVLATAGPLVFAPGVPALAQFPRAAWKRCLDQALQQTGADILDYGPPQARSVSKNLIAETSVADWDFLELLLVKTVQQLIDELVGRALAEGLHRTARRGVRGEDPGRP
ncbi:hypothetical protein ACFOZ0_29960 [Streptomyces yaanensis]|uniref:Uncharacterized protein n=1 Tax=Streptomyces yaanensis TaxID=1142239 RepID=A0ABV7SKB2_9ACTN|nr:hypothetical protein [Streptomyces sp. CGMCC 4.7035]WNC00438.1 hypothetical protein Q2K21_21565 [Streptomyces sp. CGMCC 4.7035]